jgi:hypothetical protein
VTADERIKRTAQAVAQAIGGNHINYLAITAVVLHADTCVSPVDFRDVWQDVRDPDFCRLARDGADELRERLASRGRRSVAA